MMKKKLVLFTAAVAAFGMIMSASAEQMRISTPIGYDARSADDNFLTDYGAAAWTFEVGAFTGGFSATSDNWADWDANWNAGFSANWLVAGPPAAINRVNSQQPMMDASLTGEQGYVWGYDSKEGVDAQWILLTNSAWVFPTPNELSTDLQPANDWVIGSAGTEAVVFGSVSDTGMQFQVIPEPSTYALIFGIAILGFLGYRRFRK